MLPLRYSKLWSLLGWALVCMVITLSLLPGSAPSSSALTTTLFDKAGHAILYFLLTVWFAGLYNRRWHLVVALALVVQSAVLELIQARLPYRSFDTMDLLANTGGIAVGLMLSLLVLAGWCLSVEKRLNLHP